MKVFFYFLMVSFVCVSNSFADPLSYQGIDINQDNSQMTIAVEKDASPHIFPLRNPNRLVIDLKGVKVPKSKTVKVDSPYVNQIRYGIHQDKTRLVLDLSADTKLKFSVSDDGKVVTLNMPGSTSTAQTTTTTTKSTPKVAKTTTTVVEPKSPVKKPEAQVAKKETPKPKAKKVAQQKKPEPKTMIVANSSSPLSEKTLIEPKTSPNNKKPLNFVLRDSLGQEITSNGANAPQVTAIDFAHHGTAKTPIIKISLNKKTPYALLRTGQRAYRLTIPDAAFKTEKLALPHFPPQDFNGVTLVNPEQGSGRLEIFIGVERDTKLTSFLNENEIWIKTVDEDQ